MRQIREWIGDKLTTSSILTHCNWISHSRRRMKWKRPWIRYCWQVAVSFQRFSSRASASCSECIFRYLIGCHRPINAIKKICDRMNTFECDWCWKKNCVRESWNWRPFTCSAAKTFYFFYKNKVVLQNFNFFFCWIGDVPASRSIFSTYFFWETVEMGFVHAQFEFILKNFVNASYFWCVRFVSNLRFFFRSKFSLLFSFHFLLFVLLFTTSGACLTSHRHRYYTRIAVIIFRVLPEKDFQSEFCCSASCLQTTRHFSESGDGMRDIWPCLQRQLIAPIDWVKFNHGRQWQR